MLLCIVEEDLIQEPLPYSYSLEAPRLVHLTEFNIKQLTEDNKLCGKILQRKLQ